MSEAVDKVEAIKHTSDVKYRRPLNAQQIRTLHALYWYRFCTSKQVVRVLGRTDPKAIQNKLKVLEEQQLIGKRYDKSYKLAGRPAEYFITPKGARALETARPGFTNEWANKSLYKNKTVSDDFLKHCIAISDVSHKLRGVFGDSTKLAAYTRTYMIECQGYPTWLPDLRLEIPKRGGTPAKHYFLDIWDGTKPFFVMVRKTQNYVKFREDGEWNQGKFPAILAICEDTKSQKKLSRQMKRILNDAWDDELVFATTTKHLFDDYTKPTDKIWSKIDPDGEVELTSLKGLMT